jgi:hypothetical protein
MPIIFVCWFFLYLPSFALSLCFLTFCKVPSFSRCLYNCDYVCSFTPFLDKEQFPEFIAVPCLVQSTNTIPLVHPQTKVGLLPGFSYLVAITLGSILLRHHCWNCHVFTFRTIAHHSSDLSCRTCLIIVFRISCFSVVLGQIS